MINILLDGILCVVLAASFHIGYRKGFLRTVWGLAALVITIAFTGIIQPHVSNSLRNSEFATSLNSYVYDTVNKRTSEMITSGIENIRPTQSYVDSVYSLPKNYTDSIANQLTEKSQNSISSTVNAITNKLVGMTSGIVAFTSLRVLLSMLYRVLKMIFKFPILKQTNRLAGGLSQLIIVLVIICGIIGAMTIAGTNIFDDTIICKYIYEHNILLSFIGQ